MVGSISAMSSACGPIAIPSSSSTTTTGSTSFGEIAITSSPAKAAVPTITITDVVSTASIWRAQPTRGGRCRRNRFRAGSAGDCPGSARSQYESAHHLAWAQLEQM